MGENIHTSATEMVGGTPLVRINRLYTGGSEILAKVEGNNPLSSIKDRIGLAMIEAAERDGKLAPGGEIIEPTSGNTGIALAFVGAVRGYKVTLTMPESMSLERRAVLRALGAELVLTEAAGGMKGAIAKAEELLAERPGAFMPDQFSNPANPDVHYRTTAEEIWADTDGRVDVLVAGVGTGGTLTGTTRRLRELNRNLQAFAVEPTASPVIAGGAPGPHKIQGIGAGFIPANLDVSLITEAISIGNDEAMDMARAAARQEGLFVGISSGAALAAAIKVAKRPGMDGQRIVVILPSFGERYLTSELYQQFMI
ncbi:MAG: cysteine synthase A [Candidatus Krumholzibacteria bacterium]|nr:cysteine synthase A [Candidatus Krumholzibacteria bacterium]